MAPARVVNGQTGHSGLSGAADPSCAPHVLRMKPGQTYRLRFIGATAKTIVTLGIESHTKPTIFEADGTYSQPFSTDHINVAPGQRFSALLCTMSEAELRETNRSSFWIGLENRERRQDWYAYALLQYDMPDAESLQDVPTKSPVSLPDIVCDWLEYSLQPLASNDDFPRSPTRTLSIKVTQQGIWNCSDFSTTAKWQLNNNNSWNEDIPRSPFLVDIYKHGEAAMPNQGGSLGQRRLGPGESDIGEVIDII